MTQTPGPTWRYRARVGGSLENGLFDNPSKISDGEGWRGSPVKPEARPSRKKRSN